MWLLLLMILPEHIRNRRSVKVAAFLVVVGTLVFWWYNFPFQKVHDYILQSKRGKSILLWNSNENERFFSQHSGICGSIRCEIISNRSARPIESYDAIVVIFDDQFSPVDPMELAEFQSESNNTNQKFVFYTRKSPQSLASYHNLSEFTGVFNWTMTYKRDSDIPLLYGRIAPEELSFLSPEDVLRHIERARKTFRPGPKSRISKLNKVSPIVAWMASDCNTTSQRELYVKELKNYIEVDVYGKCGNLTCDGPQCYDILVRNYKFYLSFENSLCPDYVTETFFTMMDRDVVPVVYGGADYTQFAPTHSYIDARQFKPEELATYLKILDANDTLYGEYFWWKDHYRVTTSEENMWRNSFCDLCQKLHRDFESKSYQDLISYWGDNNQCVPFDPKWIF
jgi:alpha-1,3-fucosyltransferase